MEGAPQLQLVYRTPEIPRTPPTSSPSAQMAGGAGGRLCGAEMGSTWCAGQGFGIIAQLSPREFGTDGLYRDGTPDGMAGMWLGSWGCQGVIRLMEILCSFAVAAVVSNLLYTSSILAVKSILCLVLGTPRRMLNGIPHKYVSII